MALKREAVSSYPVVAFIEPNLLCNLQCPACPTGLRLGLRPTVSIDEELFKTDAIAHREKAQEEVPTFAEVASAQR